MCRSPTHKHMQEDIFATSERPPRASRMMRRSARCGETPTEGGETSTDEVDVETLTVRPQRGRQTARQSSEAQLATVAPLLRWLMSHPAAWAMGRMAAAVISSIFGDAASSYKRPPRASCTVAQSRWRPPRASHCKPLAPTEGEAARQQERRHDSPVRSSWTAGRNDAAAMGRHQFPGQVLKSASAGDQKGTGMFTHAP